MTSTDGNTSSVGNSGMYICGAGRGSVTDQIGVALTTPTMVNQSGAPFRECGARRMRRPIGSEAPNAARASVSLTTVTGTLPSTSARVMTRPCRGRMPIASKNDAATGRTATTGRTARGGSDSPSMNNGAPPQYPWPESGTQLTTDADDTPGSADSLLTIAW